MPSPVRTHPALILFLAVLLALSTVALAGCGAEEDPASESSQTPETTGTITADDDPTGTYVGEFGATLDLEEYGTMDAVVPLTIEIAEDGSAKASWDYQTDVPVPEVDTATTSAELNGGLEGSRFAASGMATLDLEGPAGSLTDTFGVRLDGELSSGSIIGTVEFYGETEEFVTEKR